MKQELIKYLNKTVQSTVTYSRAGGGAGTIICMDFINNDMKYSLWVDCTWRIIKGKKIVATSMGNIAAVKGTIAKGAKIFENKKVLSVDLLNYYDLHIVFENNLELYVFCDISNPNAYGFKQNWDFSVIHKNLSYTITNNYTIKKGKYDTND
ncbi:hypothetical protein FACS1894180_7950 [Bacteroidia bacterium]|nr:hypothetical protein FACS1894180_7950 [Bacteroidia bacterium]